MASWASVTPLSGLTIHLAVTESGICRLGLGLEEQAFISSLQLQHPLYTWEKRLDEPLLKEACRQLTAYFHRECRGFDLPLDLRGTDFQLQVWAALRRIPFGQTRTYGEIAREIGSPNATRAVGGANHENPVAIIVPCHRVVAANGKLGGFACGLDYKRLLLDVERMAATI
jgi:O-6-methylguanine DNA methyltransferase